MDRETTSSFKSKKRPRREVDWTRNVNKRKRVSGESYETKTGKVVQAKKFEEFLCPCPNKCHTLISATQQQNIFVEFYSLDSFDLQSAFLYSQINVAKKARSYCKNEGADVVPKRQMTRFYTLNNAEGSNVKVCKVFFKKILQVSNGRIDRILENKLTGDPAPLDKRGRKEPTNKTTPDKISGVKDFISKFPTYESHYTPDKKLDIKYFSPELGIGKMYELYKSSNSNSFEPVSYFVFRKIFNTQSNLKFHAPITDSCKKCDRINIELEGRYLNEGDKQNLEMERDLHLGKAESAREGMKRDAKLASGSEEVTSIAFDLMKTLPAPALSTGICYYKRQLWTYCFGIHDLGSNDVYMYVWNESVASRGPEEIGSCLLHFVKNFVKSNKLVMYSYPQNRNIKMSLLCNHMVSSSKYSITEIDHKFLVGGHSYLPCDQDFSLIEKEKKFHEHVLTPDDWKHVIKNARKKNPFQVIEMTSESFYSTKCLEKNIKNRKVSVEKSKVSWPRIQWLQFQKEQPFLIFYKYSNEDIVQFECIDVKKRKSTLIVDNLELLYPNGNIISEEKKIDLLKLLQFIPPTHHDFYNNIRSSKNAFGGNLYDHEEEHDENDEDLDPITFVELAYLK